MSDLSLSVSVFSVAVSVAALLVAKTNVQATRTAPRVTEALKLHTKQIQRRIPDWMELLPKVPPCDSASHPAINAHRRNSLQDDRLYEDALDHHWVDDPTEHRERWERAIALEQQWSEEISELSAAAESLVETELELSRPPTQEVPRPDGSLEERTVEGVPDVYHRPLIDLLVAELLTGRVRGALERADTYWGSIPYGWDDHEHHPGQPPGAEDLVTLIWKNEETTRSLVTVQREDMEKAKAALGQQFLEKLHDELGDEANELKAVRSEIRSIRETMEESLERMEMIPLLPGPECPEVQRALGDSATG